MQIPLRRGRFFEGRRAVAIRSLMVSAAGTAAHDEAAPVAVVSEAMARDSG
jgi:hypothetical protein